MSGTKKKVAAAKKNPNLDGLLDELRTLGAKVTKSKLASAEAIQRAEKKLRFKLPAHLREFFSKVGGLAIELERTWNFYGLTDALEVTKQYREEFDEAREHADEDDGPYYPTKFLVLYDEGEFSNAASGTVYDADLDAFLVTDGARWVDEEDAFEVDYGAYVIDQLTQIRDRIADPEDVLVSGGLRDVERKNQERNEGQAAPLAAKAEARRTQALALVYSLFAKHPAPTGKAFCFNGKGCKDCKTWHATQVNALKEIDARSLFHFAYYAAVDTAAKKAAYKHFVPRILELLDELGAQGNPSVVIDGILRSVKDAGLSSAEDALVEDALRRHWERLLENSNTKVETLRAFLQPIATRRGSVGPYLAAWTERLTESVPLAHATAFAEGHSFQYDAAGHGWPQAPFADLLAWLSSLKR